MSAVPLRTKAALAAARASAPTVLPASLLFAILATTLPAFGTALAQDSPAPVIETAGKSFEVRRAGTAPRIDGAIERAWLEADSISDFVQSEPYEQAPPTEPTTVYLLQDDANLYVAFRCYSLKRPPTANYTKDEDAVTFCFDPFGSQTTGYFFQVFGSGLFLEGLVLDDGREWDPSWEGVWSRAVGIYPDRMEVEMRIPFKTIRYKAELTEWGMQFRRRIAAIRENDYWTAVTQKDGDLVSRWGRAGGIDPRSSGYYFELYPEGFVRRDDFRGEKVEVKPKGSLNLKWDLSPQTALNATAYPDFAQIESDPFSVNLSQYPLYLDERRPFFVEGTEIFRLSSFPGSGFFKPLDLFYSRRIGKPLDRDVVPILGGAKLTHKTQTWDLGGLAAWTDSYVDTGENNDGLARRFGVLRAKYRLLGNSNLGIMASGTSASRRNYNYALGTDAVIRRGASQLIAQGGLSNKNGKLGRAAEVGYKGYVGKLYTLSSYETVQRAFNVDDIGYVPWAGRRKIMLMSGPRWLFPQGTVRNLFVAPAIVRTREPGSPRWSTLGTLLVNTNLRNNWGFELGLNYGRNYEATGLPEDPYVRSVLREYSLGFWGDLAGNSIDGGLDYYYSYNYYRNYVAWQGVNWLDLNYSILPKLQASLSSNWWMEWTPQHRLTEMTERFQPRLELRLSPYMTVSVFNEMVSSTPGADLGRTRLQSDRVGMLYSWNFAPKSWLLLAVNERAALDSGDGPRRKMERQYSISALKLKYLVYF